MQPQRVLLQFTTTDTFLKRFQISSLDELPDYDELINKIAILHADKKEDEYLYSKDVYVDESEQGDLGNDEVATSDDFDLPDLSEEEMPEFLQGEDVERF